MIRDSLLSVAARLIGVVAVFGMHVILTRSLDLSGVGDFVTGLSFVAVLGIIARVGLDAVVTKRTSVYVEQQNLKGVKAVITSALGVSVGLACTCAFVLFLTAPLLAEKAFDSPGLTIVLRIMCLAIPAYCAMHVLAYVLFGLQRAAVGCLFQSAAIPLVTGISFCVLIKLGRQSAVTYSIVYVLASWLSLLCAAATVAVWLMWSPNDPKNQPGVDASPRALLNESKHLIPVSLRNVVLTWCDVWLIAAFMGSEAVAVYHAASRIVRLTALTVSGVNSVASAQFARLNASGKVTELRLQSHRFTNLMIALNFPILLGCVAVPGLLLSIFGDAYPEGASVLRILALGFVIPILSGPVGYLLIMTNQHVSVRSVALLMLLINLILNLILIPSYGLNGAAFATASAEIFGSLVSNLIAYRKLGFVVRPSLWYLAPRKTA